MTYPIRVQILLFTLLLFSGPQDRATAEVAPEIIPFACDKQVEELDWADPIAVLDGVSTLFHRSCYRQTIEVASRARESYRYKSYSFVKETAEIFVGEGRVTDYVLESYERGYLSFLILLSYQRIKETQAARVELKRFYREEVALLYNHGQDPVNALLQAVLWENFPEAGFSSRPFWLWLSRAVEADPELQGFALQRVEEHDLGMRHAQWDIAELGNFPDIDWSVSLLASKDAYFHLKPRRKFPRLCRDAHEILLPTSSWFQKIAKRPNPSYHPLVNAKAWIRLPLGLAYGIATGTVGLGMATGGCMLDFSVRAGGELCKASLVGGGAVMARSPSIVDFALRPDLRHWQNLPAALYIRGSKASHVSRCVKGFSKSKGMVNILTADQKMAVPFRVLYEAHTEARSHSLLATERASTFDAESQLSRPRSPVVFKRSYGKLLPSRNP